MSTPTSTAPAWCKGDTRPASVDGVGGNKGALNLGPINNAQPGGLLDAAAASEKPGLESPDLHSGREQSAVLFSIAVADVWKLSSLLKGLQPFTRGSVKRKDAVQVSPSYTLAVLKKREFKSLLLEDETGPQIWHLNLLFYSYILWKKGKEEREEIKETGDHEFTDVLRCEGMSLGHDKKHKSLDLFSNCGE